MRAAVKIFKGRASIRVVFWPENWAEPVYSLEFCRFATYTGSARVALSLVPFVKAFLVTPPHAPKPILAPTPIFRPSCAPNMPPSQY